MGVVSSVVFRPPRPPAYSALSLIPRLFFYTNSLNVRIPIAVSLPWVLGRRYDRPVRLAADTKWILFHHANAEDLYNTSIWTQHVCDMTNWVVIAYDYTGYGLSVYAEDAGDEDSGVSEEKDKAMPTPSEEALKADAECALEFAEKILGLKREYCVLWGRSLGCSAACHLISASIIKENRSFAGVILQAPFTSIVETVAMHHLEEPPSYDMFRNYDIIRRIGGYHCPCFVLHGENDWIVNIWHGKEMAELALPSHQWPPLYPNCGHNDLEVKCDILLKEVKEFIDFCSMRLED